MTASASLPPPLTSSARIGVAALSGAVDGATLVRGLEVLETAGFDVVSASNLGRKHGLFAGSDAERLAGFHELAADPTIEAILFARGGHGLLRLLPDIDWDLLGRRPRWFVGYSDLTPLLTQVVSRFGWVALHGPLVAADPVLEAGELEALRGAMSGTWPYEAALAGVTGGWQDVSGPLVGGCLSLMTSLLGTEWATSAAESVLFLEDTHEPLYRVDRMLQQMRLAGAFDGVHGVVLGSFETRAGELYEPEAVVASVRDAAGAGVPVAWGCPSGHCRPNATLGLGARARVEPETLRLVLSAER